MNSLNEKYQEALILLPSIEKEIGKVLEIKSRLLMGNYKTSLMELSLVIEDEPEEKEPEQSMASGLNEAQNHMFRGFMSAIIGPNYARPKNNTFRVSTGPIGINDKIAYDICSYYLQELNQKRDSLLTIILKSYAIVGTNCTQLNKVKR